MQMIVLTWRRHILLVLFSFLALSFTGLFLLYHKSLEMPLHDMSELHGSQGNARHTKYTHLVLGEAAGQGLVGRLQCKGSSVSAGKNKTQSCSRSIAGLSFVTFFVPPNDELPHDNVKAVNAGVMEFGNVTISKADRPYTVLSIFMESIQISNPGSITTILTGQSSRILTARLPGNVVLHRLGENFARNNLMLQRLESYIYFLGEVLAKLQSSKHTGSIEHIVFMDADIIVVDNLQCLFETYTDFDIALTFRNNKDQPINSGVIMIRGEAESVSRARGFLQDVVRVYKDKYAKAARMLGDQLSLAAVVQEHSEEIGLRFKKPSIFKSWISGRKVLFLPSQIYNWTPSEGAGQFHGMPEDVKVLHFKGSRKRLMIEAWNFFKGSGRSLLDMECLILRSGRTKYDF
eukprot:c10434_g1_i1 orf=101-1312(+)